MLCDVEGVERVELQVVEIGADETWQTVGSYTSAILSATLARLSKSCSVETARVACIRSGRARNQIERSKSLENDEPARRRKSRRNWDGFSPGLSLRSSNSLLTLVLSDSVYTLRSRSLRDSYGESPGSVIISAACCMTWRGRYGRAYWNLELLLLTFAVANTASSWQNHSLGSSVQNPGIRTNGPSEAASSAGAGVVWGFAPESRGKSSLVSTILASGSPL